MEENIHANHRERMRKKFFENGLDGFADHEVLEFVLFNSIKRADTNATAHRLMKSFGSLSAVFDAQYEELIKVKGVGETSAVLLSMFPQVCRRYLKDVNTAKLLLSTEDAVEYFRPYFIGLKNERVYMLCLDSKKKILKCEKVCEGSYNAVDVSVRRIVELAASTSSTTGVLIAHNHPSGNAAMSDDDVVTTKKIKNALNSINIVLDDHIIVADNDCISMRDTYEWMR